MSRRNTMGDMRTPDFDDLLAAFDIPDMVDPKAAIESGQVDHESQIQPTNIAITQDELESAQDVGISVIVKNTRNKDNKGDLHSPILSKANRYGHQNNCLFSVSSVNNHQKNEWRPPNDNGPIAPMNTSSMNNNFSPISSAEETDEEGKTDMEESDDKSGSQTHKQSDSLVSENSFVKERPQESVKHAQNNSSPEDACSPNTRNDSIQQKELKGSVPIPQVLSKTDEPPRPVCFSNVNPEKSKTSHKLFTCIAATAGLSAKKDSTEHYETIGSLQSKNKPILVSSHQDDSPATSKIIHNSETSQNMLQTKLSENPLSISSKSSSKRSPASNIDKKNSVIPKVCIKTVKSKTGQIKHTVTSERMKKSETSNNQDFMETKCAILPSPRHLLTTTEAGIAAGFVNEVTKQMTIKPVATAFLPASAVKGAGSQVINLKLGNNTTVKATVIPSSSMQSTNSGIPKVVNGIQQQAVIAPTSNLVNTKLSKTVHLGNLSLLPQTMAPSACEQQTFTLSLKHQQQKQLKTLFSAQTSKKASKVQALESSQKSVVDAFNKVLSSINPVPMYVPDLSPPSSACITLPSHGYKCLECGDSFALERSLAQHYGRRSVRIDVTCNQCTKSLVFYNKCSLLSHARSHKDKGMIMQCSHLILKPIPADQMVITSSPAWIYETTTLTVEEDKSRDKSIICWECNEKFEDVSSLSTHYQQESDGQKTCSVCQMVLPNQCSFRSHQRIHKHKSPFICPECGVNCQSANFQSHHVTNTCLHYTRHNGYRCVHCSAILTDASTLKSHIQSNHCEIFYKCPICPMAFKSAPGTHSHSSTQHPGVKAGEPKLIHKCAMCDTVFTLQSLLYTHLDQHVNTHRVPIFKCPDCSMYYAQKQLMMDHIKTIHGALKTLEGPNNLAISLPLSTRSTNSNSLCSNSNNIKDSENENCHIRPDKNLPKSKTAKWKNKTQFKSTSSNGYICVDCNTDYLSREAYVGHMRKEHGKILKKHPCHHCEKSFCSTHSLCRHNRLKHKVFTCVQCPTLSQPFTKRVQLEQHIQLTHGDQGRTAVNTNITETTAAENMTCTKRKTEDTEVSASENCRSSDSAPLKKLKVKISKVLKCAVCGFNTENIATFHGHIPKHKSNGSSYQCKECGLCYTSPRSLSRHLFIVHRLKDPHRHYHRQNGGCDDSQQENQLNSENDDGTPNTRCKVCSQEFETEAILNTHMRTHGMAFIKAKASRVRAEKRRDQR